MLLLFWNGASAGGGGGADPDVGDLGASAGATTLNRRKPRERFSSIAQERLREIVDDWQERNDAYDRRLRDLQERERRLRAEEKARSDAAISAAEEALRRAEELLAARARIAEVEFIDPVILAEMMRLQQLMSLAGGAESIAGFMEGSGAIWDQASVLQRALDQQDEEEIEMLLLSI